jgi:hypothetical protein
MKTNTFEKLSEKRQIEILDASAKIFAEKGYFQAGIIEICQTTGICIFRMIPAGDSGGSRPPIPIDSGHRFRTKPATHSGAFRPPL